ncbi:hypothetical protein MNEG_2845 [Monoraphidium neglectum]|uniref:Senescence domain-containing protein n=1 Tax=Monoraphidium neglectum TaxID=145388 RepID=A0A0D2LEL0_9CHLO|nr:hypothetical protein MNEG_2845 [Monoraphidium neglectum]KIZ05109.1 hypothetical protein MNEG_2845 [Monoraphidium neglectum]|eukprot:XP_013904128.1 hypothetical protein MNEG_2845 [Monoraphidium neglectum]
MLPLLPLSKSPPSGIDLIWGQWHNLPSLPSPIRNINGMFMGALPHMMEPVWGRTMEFVGDDFYKKKMTGWGCDELIASKCRERHLADGTAGAVDQAIDLGSTAVTNVGELVSNVASTLMDTARKAVDTGKYYADTTTQAARETARSAADTATGAARSAYEAGLCCTKAQHAALGGVIVQSVLPADVSTTMRKDMPMTDKAREAAARTAERAREAARGATGPMEPSGTPIVAR